MFRLARLFERSDPEKPQQSPGRRPRADSKSTHHSTGADRPRPIRARESANLRPFHRASPIDTRHYRRPGVDPPAPREPCEAGKSLQFLSSRTDIPAKLFPEGGSFRKFRTQHRLEGFPPGSVPNLEPPSDSSSEGQAPELLAPGVQLPPELRFQFPTQPLYFLGTQVITKPELATIESYLFLHGSGFFQLAEITIEP